MDQNFLQQIEEAALNAWPAARQMRYDGWLLRFTGGTSKRVNSVNVLEESHLPLEEKIAFCERMFTRQGLTTIFRMPDLPTSPVVRLALQAAGYGEFDPTYVLGREITRGNELPDVSDVRLMESGGWLQMWSLLMKVPLSALVHHAAILEAIVPEKVLLGLFVDGKPMACGMGVAQEKFLGYFSIFTDVKTRRRGFGAQIMAALTRWGRERGAAVGYLQVEADNTSALMMYKKLGFDYCYRYSYFER